MIWPNSSLFLVFLFLIFSEVWEETLFGVILGYLGYFLFKSDHDEVSFLSRKRPILHEFYANL